MILFLFKVMAYSWKTVPAKAITLVLSAERRGLLAFQACLIPSSWHFPTVGDGWSSQRRLSLALVSSYSAHSCTQLQELCGLRLDKHIWKMCGCTKWSFSLAAERSVVLHQYEKQSNKKSPWWLYEEIQSDKNCLSESNFNFNSLEHKSISTDKLYFCY